MNLLSFVGVRAARAARIVLDLVLSIKRLCSTENAHFCSQFVGMNPCYETKYRAHMQIFVRLFSSYRLAIASVWRNNSGTTPLMDTTAFIGTNPEALVPDCSSSSRSREPRSSRLLRFDPSGFDDTRRAFTLGQYEACELRLCHVHRIAPMLRNPLP